MCRPGSVREYADDHRGGRIGGYRMEWVDMVEGWKGNHIIVKKFEEKDTFGIAEARG